MTKAIVNSLPKSGTNLVLSMLEHFPGLSFQKVTLNRNLGRLPLVRLVPRVQRCLVGVDQPKWAPLPLIRLVLGRLGEGRFAGAHLPHDPQLEQAIEVLGIRAVFVVRDPRDIVVSQIHHVMARPRHFLYPAYAALDSDRARVLAAIRGIGDQSARGPGGLAAQGIASKLRLTAGWLQSPTCLDYRFEDLIGPRGGGSEDRQIESIQRLGEHLDRPLSREQARTIGGAAFGKRGTYRKGRIGGWRELFNEEVAAAMKVEAGAQLIELGYETDLSW